MVGWASVLGEPCNDSDVCVFADGNGAWLASADSGCDLFWCLVGAGKGLVQIGNFVVIQTDNNSSDRDCATSSFLERDRWLVAI